MPRSARSCGDQCVLETGGPLRNGYWSGASGRGEADPAKPAVDSVTGVSDLLAPDCQALRDGSA